MKELLLNLDWAEIASAGLAIVVYFFGKFWVKAKPLIIAFANAIEDDKIDANERKDLVALAKALLGNKAISVAVAGPTDDEPNGPDLPPKQA